MLVKNYYTLSLLTVVLGYNFYSKPVLAFTIKPPEVYKPKYIEEVSKNTKIEGWVNPIKEIKLGGTNGFRRILTQDRRFKNWDFNWATSDLKGTLDLNVYKACSPKVVCLPDQIPSQTGGVGALLVLKYLPAAGEDNSMSRFAFIQRVTSNHKGGELNHGINENIIDTGDQSNATTPFFLVGTSFLDAPYRLDHWNDHNWMAELYVVKQTISTRTVTIYNGIQWGWGNKVTRRRSDPPACTANSTDNQISTADYGGPPDPPPPPECEESGLSLESFQLSDTTRQISDNQSQSVPEPSYVFGLLFVGIWSVSSLRKQQGSSER